MNDILTKEGILEYGKTYVEGIMREKGEIGLMIFGHTDDGGVMAFPLNQVWGKSPLMRDIAVAAVRSKLRASEARSYLAVLEAWMVDHRMDKDEQIDAAMRTVGSPSEHPDRIEVVALIAGDATGTISTVYRLKRTESGRFSHLDLYTIDDEAVGMSDGRLVDLLIDKAKAH
jgi:hypothetical protein